MTVPSIEQYYLKSEKQKFDVFADAGYHSLIWPSSLAGPKGV
jgi:hypothetical protein